MSVFTLKLIAVFCMICDHIRYIDFESTLFNNIYTQILGRIAFPIFAFLIVEGYSHTKDIKKYIKRLGLFSMVSQIPFLIFIWGCGIIHNFKLNVIFTMLIGVFALLSYDKIKNKVLKLFSIILLVVLAELLQTDYGAIGILIILNFYIFKNSKILKYLIFLFICILQYFIVKYISISYLIRIMPYIVGYIFSIIPLLFYNKKLGKFKLKYFFYIFYPLHMVVIYLIHICI